MRAVVALSLLAASAAHAQQMDMDAMMKWGAADLIRYHIVGVYQGTPIIASDGAGHRGRQRSRGLRFLVEAVRDEARRQADVPELQDHGGEAARPRTASACRPCSKATTSTTKCSASRKDCPARSISRCKPPIPWSMCRSSAPGNPRPCPRRTTFVPEQFVVVSPVTFGMPLPDSDDLRISPDKKSLIAKKDGWTWTYTPTILPRK